MINLSEISRDLRSSYQALEERAKAVEEELHRTNLALESKVAELDAVNANLEAILGSLPTGVLVRDAHGRIVRTNGAARELLGYRAEELLGMDEVPELAVQPNENGTLDVVAHDGRRVVIASKISPVGETDSIDSSAQGSVQILDDRTVVARMSQRMHQMDKMAALGTVAGGIAHELRNPMNAVLGFASLLKRSLAAETKESRWAERICDGVFEVDSIITSLLTFADPEKLRPETVHSAAFLEEVETLITRDLAESLAGVELRLHGEDVEFVADRVMLRQALRNLVANAIQAQPDGGSVEVRLSVQDDDVVLDVFDEGPGIPTELARRVTEPFYTTRPEGTGLGLPLVHTIAELHGGSLEIVSDPAPPVGAQITLRFPQNPEK